jgi:hypothetical protein
MYVKQCLQRAESREQRAESREQIEQRAEHRAAEQQSTAAATATPTPLPLPRAARSEEAIHGVNMYACRHAMDMDMSPTTQPAETINCTQHSAATWGPKGVCPAAGPAPSATSHYTHETTHYKLHAHARYASSSNPSSL